MAIRVDPIVSAAIPRELLQESSGKLEGRAQPPVRDGLEFSTGPLPRATSDSKPRPQTGQRSLSKIEQEGTRLRAALKAGGAQAVLAAGEALALAASYAMRRSRGARRQALDLCELVSAEVPERADLANKLRHVLLAEAYLHQNDPDSVLRACRALVLMLRDADGGSDAGP